MFGSDMFSDSIYPSYPDSCLSRPGLRDVQQITFLMTERLHWVDSVLVKWSWRSFVLRRYFCFFTSERWFFLVSNPLLECMIFRKLSLTFQISLQVRSYQVVYKDPLLYIRKIHCKSSAVSAPWEKKTSSEAFHKTWNPNTQFSVLSMKLMFGVERCYVLAGWGSGE